MPPALVCLSHLRWDFVYQRPNHLMARAARNRRVYFVEEPTVGEGAPKMESKKVDGLTVVRPRLPDGLAGEERDSALERLMNGFIRREAIESPWLWYYTPMALAWTRRVDASA